VERKACVACGLVLELCEKNFHKSKDGFHSRCKRCRNKNERNARKKLANGKMDEIEKGAINTFIAAARVGGANIPHSSELLECLMTYFGGVLGFSNAFMKQYFDAPAGGAFRTKMLDVIVRLTSTNTAMGGAKKPLTHWSEDELEDELRERLMEAAITIRATPVTHIGHEEPTSAEAPKDTAAEPA